MSLPCVVTVWFVNAPDPGAVLSGEPKADRGFGRKLLAQLNPAWPITAIGDFPLNRSSQPGRAEFYIAGYPGVAVVQTFVEDVTTASEAASTTFARNTSARRSASPATSMAEPSGL